MRVWQCEHVHPAAPSTYDDAAELLKALAHPLRLLLIHELADGPRCVHELVTTSGAAQPLVSQHLKVLRGARVVTSRRRAREVVYALADEHVIHIAADAVRHSQEEHP
ncbi:MAG: winged helix-turn-helix transcriptional regulator [Pseudorhodobacter sp.]|nr:winged helix-turn-helix transcriptional regulator [Frankiaceae bacterium]